MQRAWTPTPSALPEVRFATTPEKNDGVGARIGQVILGFGWNARNGTVRLAVTDELAPELKTAPDRQWYPIDERLRVEARWMPLSPAKKITITNSDGDTLEREIIGYAEFELEGRRLRLAGQQANKVVFFPFTDRTAPRETYGGGRYLYAAPAAAGMIVLDFNEAENPNCALNPNWTCVRPPRENSLPLAIKAGEKNYPGLTLGRHANSTVPTATDRSRH
jgi:uncharacterized protein (DUF1684 family)